MSALIKDLDRKDLDDGRVFSYFYYRNSMVRDSSFELVFETGSKPVKITRMEIIGSSSLVSWKWYNDPLITGGTLLPFLRRNPIKIVDPKTKVWIDPTLDDPGVILVENIDALGVPVSLVDNMSSMLDAIIDEPVIFPADVKRGFSLKNRHLLGTGVANVGVRLSFTVLEDPHA